MAEKGQVAETRNGFALVRMTRKEACAKCRACVAGMKEEEMFIEAENACNANVNDWVEIDISGKSFMSAVLIMYGIPFIALISGIFIGYFGAPYVAPSFKPELAGSLLGVILTGLTFLFIRLNEKRWNTRKYRPVAFRLADKD